MDYALVFKWVRAFPGREAKALENLADFRMFFDKLATEGKVTEPLLLMHVNDGMMIVRGEMEPIFDIVNREEFILLVDKAMLVCEGFAFHTYFTGEMMEHRLELYTKAGKELNYI
jgi:hypothetical protein